MRRSTGSEFLQAGQKIQVQGARKIEERRRTASVRCRESVKQNDADGLFSTA
jgi:hypothetical protein